MMNEKVKHWNKFDQLCTLCNVHGSSSYQKNEKARKKRNKTNTDYKQNRMLHLTFKINSIRNDWPMNFISLGIGLNRRCRLNDAKSFGQVLIDIAPFWTIQSFSTHSHKSYRYSFRMKNSFRILFFWGRFFLSLFFIFYAYKCGLLSMVVVVVVVVDDSFFFILELTSNQNLPNNRSTHSKCVFYPLGLCCSRQGTYVYSEHVNETCCLFHHVCPFLFAFFLSLSLSLYTYIWMMSD